MYYIPESRHENRELRQDTKKNLDSFIEQTEKDGVYDLIIIRYESSPPGTDYRCAKPDDIWSLEFAILPKFGSKSIWSLYNVAELSRYSHIDEILIDTAVEKLDGTIPDDACTIPVFTSTDDVVNVFNDKTQFTVMDRLRSFKLSILKFKLSVLRQILTVCLNAAKKTEGQIGKYQLTRKERVHKMIGDLDRSTRMTTNIRGSLS